MTKDQESTLNVSGWWSLWRVRGARPLAGLLALLAVSCSPSPTGGGQAAAAATAVRPTAASSPQTAVAALPSPTSPPRRETVKQGILGTVSDAGFLIGIA